MHLEELVWALMWSAPQIGGCQWRGCAQVRCNRHLQRPGPVREAGDRQTDHGCIPHSHRDRVSAGNLDENPAQLTSSLHFLPACYLRLKYSA
jgi:hypothetical protein